MSARPISSATINFGLVAVPVNLYSASEGTSKISFNWIHKKDGSRLKQQYVCAKDGEVVENDDRVKGYEVTKDRYVLFTPEELKALEAEKTERIDITEFVPFDQVERLYLDKVYYLGPAKGGERAYRLLSEALQETGLSAVAKYAARGKQYLVLVRPMDDGLAMEQLHYANELKAFTEVPIPDLEPGKEELKLAVQLIKQGAVKKFEPDKYKDEVRERQLELIQEKVDGKDITQAPQEEPQVQILDLMEALKKSLAKKPPREQQQKMSASSKRKRATRKKAATR